MNIQTNIQGSIRNNIRILSALIVCGILVTASMLAGHVLAESPARPVGEVEPSEFLSGPGYYFPDIDSWPMPNPVKITGALKTEGWFDMDLLDKGYYEAKVVTSSVSGVSAEWFDIDFLDEGYFDAKVSLTAKSDSYIVHGLDVAGPPSTSYVSAANGFIIHGPDVLDTVENARVSAFIPYGPDVVDFTAAPLNRKVQADLAPESGCGSSSASASASLGVNRASGSSLADAEFARVELWDAHRDARDIFPRAPRFTQVEDWDVYRDARDILP